MFGIGTFTRVARELRQDLTAAQERDPAARDIGRVEILLTYPGCTRCSRTGWRTR